jgi:hypothetical protein
MNIRKFDKEKDYLQMCSWYKAHAKPSPYITSLSTNGFIVENICMGFLYSTDSDIAFIEGYISNPDCNRKDRKEALDILSNRLLDEAKALGFKKVLSFSNRPSVKSRMKKYGYEIIQTDLVCGMRSL